MAEGNQEEIYRVLTEEIDAYCFSMYSDIQ